MRENPYATNARSAVEHGLKVVEGDYHACWLSTLPFNFALMVLCMFGMPIPVVFLGPLPLAMAFSGFAITRFVGTKHLRVLCLALSVGFNLIIFVLAFFSVLYYDLFFTNAEPDFGQ